MFDKLSKIFLKDNNITEDNLEIEKLLIKEILSWNIDKYSFIVQKYEAKLIKFINNILLTNNYQLKEGEIDNIIQEIFIKIYKNLHSYNNDYAFSTWLYKIARNFTLNYVRDNKDKKQILNESDFEKFQEEDTERSLFELIEDDSKDIVKNLLVNEKNNAIYYLLNKLDTKYKEVLMLKYLENKSYEEISDIMEIPETTVSTYIKRAKEQFKKKLKNEKLEIKTLFNND